MPPTTWAPSVGDRERLVNLLALLASDHVGEVAAAGRTVNALVFRACLIWSEVLLPALPAIERQSIQPRSAAWMVNFCTSWAAALGQSELRFVQSVRPDHLSPSQAEELRRLWRKGDMFARKVGAIDEGPNT